MRKALLFFGPVAFAAGLFACEDGGGNPAGGNFVLDGGSFEAGSPFEAGPQPDAAVDPDAGALAVTVNVQRALGPAADVTVVFHDADGLVLETKTTGADGKATSSDGVRPAMATALLGGGPRKHILTWTAVEVGDQLFARDIEDQGENSFGSFTANFAPYGGTDANNHYYASVGECGGFETSQGGVLVNLYGSCRGLKSSLLLAALDNDYALLGYAFKKGNPAPPLGGSAEVAVGSWLMPSEVMLTMVGLPADSSTNQRFFAISEDLAFDSVSLTYDDEQSTYAVAPGFADAFQGTVSYRPSGDPSAKLLVSKRVAPGATEVALDFAGALPLITDSNVDATNVKRPVVSWTSATSLASTDGGSIAIGWYDERDQQSSWSFVVPPGTTTVSAPVLPAAADDWAPLDDSAYDELHSVFFVEASTLPNYAAFRHEAGRVIPLSIDDNDLERHLILPADGVVRVTSRTPRPLVR